MNPSSITDPSIAHPILRWIGIRMDLLAATFSSGLAAYLTYTKSTTAAKTGFSLNMAGTLCCKSYAIFLEYLSFRLVGFSGVILWWVRYLNLLETRGNRQDFCLSESPMSLTLRQFGAYQAVSRHRTRAQADGRWCSTSVLAS